VFVKFIDPLLLISDLSVVIILEEVWFDGEYFIMD